jgi:phasin family protein
MTTKTTKTTNATMATSMEDIAAASQEAFQALFQASTENYGKAFATARERAEEFVKGYDDVAFGGKETIDAMVKAGTAYTKGIEAISAEWMAFGRQMMEDNISVTKKVMGAKTLREAMDLQSEFARTSFDGAMAQTTKIGEMATKVAQESVEPINSQPR